MTSYALALLPGDGIGPEVMKVALDVINALGQKYDFSHNKIPSLVLSCLLTGYSQQNLCLKGQKRRFVHKQQFLVNYVFFEISGRRQPWLVAWNARVEA